MSAQINLGSENTNDAATPPAGGTPVPQASSPSFGVSKADSVAAAMAAAAAELGGRPRFLRPVTDFTFKLIFGEHKHVCISLLNALLPLGKGKIIEDIEYLSPELTPDVPGKRNSIVDVRCRDIQGREFLVEMQLHWSSSFVKRVVYNTAKAYSWQLSTGDSFSDLRPVYALCFLNQVAPVFDKFPDEYYHCYSFKNQAHPEDSLDEMEMVFVELPKFHAGRHVDKYFKRLWLRFLTEVGEKLTEVPAELKGEPVICDALRYLERSSYSEEQMRRYIKSLAMDDLERTRERDWVERGREEGKKEGREEGAAAKNIENARKMKAKGFSDEDIAEITGLAMEDVASL